MTEAEAWLAQVESDFAAAQSVFQIADPSTYCQSISKYQQVVEKSINVIDAVLREQGVFLGRVRPEHYPLKMINRLVRLPLRQDPDLAANMQRIFTRWGADIHDLCLFAPKLPPVGQRYQQNTEYPYQNEDGTWTAPSAPASFSLAQVQRFATTARSLRREAQEISTAARLNKL
jgi:hypothetical protein